MVALWKIGLKPTMSDPNVRIRSEMRPGEYEYYEMLLVYVDNIMIVSHLVDEVSKQIGKFYNIKEGNQGPPTRYPWVYTEKIQTKDGCEI